MIKTEKINIYIPQETGEILENDAVQFEIFKKDGRTINKNRYLTMLIKGYYDEYIKESKTKYREICSILDEIDLDDANKSDIANKIVKDVILPKIPVRKGKNPVRLSLKPTKESIPVLQQIEDDFGADEYISQIFCRLLMSYCEKPFSIREKILFKANYDLLESACREQSSVRFSTIWNQEVTHEVIPYKIVTSKEEMYNYLLCAERNKETGIMETRSYRLNRITQLRYGNIKESIPKDVIRHLEMMIQYGPQFAINEDVISCVRLTEEGRNLFSRIYFNRPSVDRVEKDGKEWLYYFKTSTEQLYQYFKRFENGYALVLYPCSLKERIQTYHEYTLKAYL